MEQFLVLSGRIRFNDVEMTAGDFMKVGAGDEHAAHALEDTLVFFAHRRGVVMKGLIKTSPETGSSRKETLTALAVDMMQAQGFSALALRDLAQAAHIRAASLYNHFSSKDELARLAMSRYSAGRGAELSAPPSGRVTAMTSTICFIAVSPHSTGEDCLMRSLHGGQFF